MRTVSLYLLREFLFASTAVFLALLVTWLAADTLLHLDRLSEDQGRALFEVAARALEVIPLGVPMACLIGVVLSLTHAVRFREITAIRCGGIPLQSALAPVLLASLAIAVCIGLVEDRVIVPARLALLDDAGERKEARPTPHKIHGRWWYASGRLIFSAAGYDPDLRILNDVSMFELDAGHTIRRRIEAAHAVNVEGDVWELRDATNHTFGGPEGLRVRDEPSIRVDLGVSVGDMERATPPLQATSLHRLAARIRDFGGRASDLIQLEASFHGRLAQPLAVLVLVLLSIPFAIGHVERGDSMPRALLRSMCVAALFWLTWTLAVLAARSGALPPALPVWTAVLVFLGVGGWRFRRIAQ